MKITRGELGNVLSSLMQTQTIHNRGSEEDVAITDEWTVVKILVTENGILRIYCEMPDSESI